MSEEIVANIVFVVVIFVFIVCPLVFYFITDIKFNVRYPEAKKAEKERIAIDSEVKGKVKTILLNGFVFMCFTFWLWFLITVIYKASKIFFNF